MPIPTRSLSLREPNKQPTRSGTPARLLKPIPDDNNSSNNNTSSPSPPPLSSAQESSSRRKSLLPQRSLGRESEAVKVKVRPAPSHSSQQQQQENRLREVRTQGKEVPSQRTPAEKAVVENAARRRSLIMRPGMGSGLGPGPGPGLGSRPRPSPLKMGSTVTSSTATPAATTVSSAGGGGSGGGVGTTTNTNTNTSRATRTPLVPTTPKSAAFMPRSASPRKRDPPSPRKTGADSSMPPPPRPNRSASLRQPLVAGMGMGMGSGTGTGTGTGIAGPKGHVRHRSQIIAPSTGQARRSDSQSSGSVAGSTATATTGTSRGAQFSTYQQQFSPKKVGKASTGMGMEAAAVEESTLLPATWPELAALQTELLQLSLLHSSSVQRRVQAETESQAQLRATYGAVAKRYRAMVGHEKNRQRLLNGLALDHWLASAKEHRDRQEFAAQIQAFSQVLQEVCDLTDARGGTYTLLVQAFEDWFDKSQAIESMRLHCQPGDSSHVVFIDPLDLAWKDKVSAVTMKLEQCARQLQSLDLLGYAELADATTEESALLRTARGLDEMLASMLEELRMIRRMETAVVKSEQQWVSQLTEELTATRTGTHTHAREARGPKTGMWRTALLGC